MASKCASCGYSDQRIERPSLIVCEGQADSAFVRKLIKARSIPDVFQVHATQDLADGGLDGLGDYLDVALGGFRVTPRSLVLVFDSEDKPDSRFDAICSILESRGLPKPNRPMEIVRGESLALAVSLLPQADRPGNLETFILGALEDKYRDVLDCIDENLACAGLELQLGKRDKARLTCLIASIAIKGKPDLTLKPWLEKSFCPLDFNHPSFNELAGLLFDDRLHFS